MKTTAAAAVLTAVCAAAACHQKGTPLPTAPSIEEQAIDGGTPVPPPEYPHTGETLVAYITDKYLDRLSATADYDTRARNMEFVRDRMIEAGICGGMDLARNLKRGVGPLSADAIAWRPDGVTVEVVDIAVSWDTFWEPLRLQWTIVSGPAGWSPVEAPTCG